jgi:hypothetical protein
MSDDQSHSMIAPTEAAAERLPDASSIAPAEMTRPAAKPIVRDDPWAQTARGIHEAIARDLKLSKRLDELLSRPIGSQCSDSRTPAPSTLGQHEMG